MDKILIEGGVALTGDIAISGSKNAVLPLMVAGLLTDEKLTLRGTPRLADTRTLANVLRELGAEVEEFGQGPGEGDATSLDPSSCSDPLLQHLVKLLRSIMSGFPAAGFDAGDASMPPVSALEYYETLMLFFERLGCSLGAMRCAHAALREVETAHAEDAAARLRRAARLWANLLQYALDLGDWSAAYAAVLSVPGADAQNAALRRLVAALCEPGDVRGGAAAL